MKNQKSIWLVAVEGHQILQTRTIKQKGFN